MDSGIRRVLGALYFVLSSRYQDFVKVTDGQGLNGSKYEARSSNHIFHATHLSPFIWSQESVALATDDWRRGASISRQRLVRIGGGDELLRLDDSVPCSAAPARAK